MEALEEESGACGHDRDETTRDRHGESATVELATRGGRVVGSGAGASGGAGLQVSVCIAGAALIEQNTYSTSLASGGSRGRVAGESSLVDARRVRHSIGRRNLTGELGRVATLNTRLCELLLSAVQYVNVELGHIVGGTRDQRAVDTDLELGELGALYVSAAAR